IDLSVDEDAFPNVEVAGRKIVSPGMLPLAGLSIESPQPETFHGASVIDPFKEFQRDQTIQDSRRVQRPGRFFPSVARRNATTSVPLSFQKIECAFVVHKTLHD